MSRKSDFSIMDLILLGCAVIWGVNTPIVKIGLNAMPSLPYNMLRLLIALIPSWLLVFARREYRRVEMRDVPALLTVSFLGFAVFQVCFTLGVSHTTSGNASLILGMGPISVAIINKICGLEGLTRRMALGILLSFIGLATVITGSGASVSFSSENLLGIALMLGAQLSFAYYMVFAKPLLRRYSASQITAYVITASVILFLMLSAKDLIHLNWSSIPAPAWSSLLYSGLLGIALANFLWSWGIRKIGSTRTALYSNLPPVFAIITGCIMLDETFGLIQIAGATLIFTGLCITRSQGPSGEIRTANGTRR